MSVLASPTLGKLIFNVRNLLGQPNAVNSAWTDAELKEYINEGIRQYFALVVKNSEGYFMPAPYTFDVVSGVEEVPLPTDFFELKALYIQRTNGWEILEYRNNITSGFQTQLGSGGTNTYEPYYYFRGNNLVLHPTPNFTSSNGTFRMDYIGFPDQMINGGDTLTNQVSPVFKQLIEMYAVKKAKLKQSMVSGTDLVSIPKRELDEIAALFAMTINKRSNHPEYVIPYSPEGDF